MSKLVHLMFLYLETSSFCSCELQCKLKFANASCSLLIINGIFSPFLPYWGSLENNVRHILWSFSIYIMIDTWLCVVNFCFGLLYHGCPSYQIIYMLEFCSIQLANAMNLRTYWFNTNFMFLYCCLNKELACINSLDLVLESTFSFIG